MTSPTGFFLTYLQDILRSCFLVSSSPPNSFNYPLESGSGTPSIMAIAGPRSELWILTDQDNFLRENGRWPADPGLSLQCLLLPHTLHIAEMNIIEQKPGSLSDNPLHFQNQFTQLTQILT